MDSLKRHYAGLKLTSECYACESQMLVGSKTAMKISIHEVEVEPYTDGFETEGGFMDVSFE